MYYQQSVMATIDANTLQPIKVDLLGQKEPLDKNLFNSTNFEHLLNEGILANSEVRGDIVPSRTVPHYYESVIRANVSLGTGPNNDDMIHDMAGLALTVGNRPMEDYLDWQTLSKSYADAYRLMFASVMKEILSNDNFSTFDDTTGKIQTTNEAVVLVPVFVYIVEALLAIVSLSTIALFYLSLKQKYLLRSDPGTIAAMMAVVADDQPLLSDIEGLNCSTMDQMTAQLARKRYKLVDSGSSISIVELNPDTPTIVNPPRRTLTDIAKPVRPIEFSLWIALPVISFFIILATCLGVVFVKARDQGLPLPSSNAIVQNLLENYVPTAIATLIEPIWVLTNRLLCMLQPIEELQDCNVRAEDSIDLNYSSLPPQLVIFKALRSKHFVLASVCTMTLLANLLAIAFSGLFNQITINIKHAAVLNQPLDFKFVNINDSIGPTDDIDENSFQISGAFEGGDGQDQFFVADSYLRQGSSLAAWVDDTMFYMPFAVRAMNTTNNNRLQAKTRAFGAKLECTPLTISDAFQAKLGSHGGGSSVSLTVTRNSGITAQCAKSHMEVSIGPAANTTNFGSNECVTGPVRTELTFALEAATNATQAESEVCMGSVVLGWLRYSNGTCASDWNNATLTALNYTFVHCRPKLFSGLATVEVDSVGRLQQKVPDFTPDDYMDKTSTSIFSTDPSNLIGQSNKYLFYQSTAEWHNDSFTDDNFINYFIKHLANTNRFLHPKQGVPSFNDIEKPLQKAHPLLFAIWMGSYMNRLLIPYPTADSPNLDGWRVVPEQRVVLLTPMFVIAECILCIYVVAAIMVYLRRPGRYLARLPTSIASVVAMFAASAAVTDMRGTSYLSEKERAIYFEKLDVRYGYGSFVGGNDGRVHIGIEKTPFVRRRARVK